MSKSSKVTSRTFGDTNAGGLGVDDDPGNPDPAQEQLELYHRSTTIHQRLSQVKAKAPTANSHPGFRCIEFSSSLGFHAYV
jgi:hypothetical protein